jgi:hypothetical protein
VTLFTSFALALRQSELGNAFAVAAGMPPREWRQRVEAQMKSLLSALAFFGLMAAQFLAVTVVYRARLDRWARGPQKIGDDADAASGECSPTETSTRQARAMQVGEGEPL